MNLFVNYFRCKKMSIMNLILLTCTFRDCRKAASFKPYILYLCYSVHLFFHSAEIHYDLIRVRWSLLAMKKTIRSEQWMQKTVRSWRKSSGSLRMPKVGRLTRCWISFSCKNVYKILSLYYCFQPGSEDCYRWAL